MGVGFRGVLCIETAGFLVGRSAYMWESKFCFLLFLYTIITETFVLKFSFEIDIRTVT